MTTGPGSASAPAPGGDLALPPAAAAPTLAGDADSARHQLPRRVVNYWRVQSLLFGVPVVAVATTGALLLDWFTPTVRCTVVGLLAAYFLVAFLTAPIRHRIFWYALSDNEIDIESGVLVRQRTVVPMSRVQHLKSQHGPVSDRFRLATLHVHTAAGMVPINGLDRDEADAVRARIATLAQLTDDA